MDEIGRSKENWHTDQKKENNRFLSFLSVLFLRNQRLCATLKDVSVLKCIWRMEEAVSGVIIKDEQVDHLQSFTVPSGIIEAWHTAGTYQPGREEDSLNNSLLSFISNYNKGLLWSHTGNAVTQLCDSWKDKSMMVKWKNCVQDRNNFITLLTQNDVRGECIMTSALQPQPGLQQLTQAVLSTQACTLPATTSVSSMITVEITVKCFLADFQLCYYT